jgi:hypothetical protein
MHATQIKHAANLEEWKRRIMECRASGLTVREWCSQNSWSTSTYYRWEREAFGSLEKDPGVPEGCCTAVVPVSRQALVELPISSPPAIGSLATDKETPAKEIAPIQAFHPVAILRMGDTELSLTNEVSHILMRQLKDLLSNAAGR